jgi:tetratricopeptide (TPR) repeat protein
LGNAGRYRDGQQLIDQLMEANPEPEQRLRLLYSQATLSRLRGDAAEADSAMEQVLTMRPFDESLSNDLSYAWIDRGVRLDEAEKLIRFALGRIPRQAAYLDTYGWLLYKKGDFDGAATWLSRANRVRGGDDPVIFDHLGDTYWNLGRKDDAVAQWRIAVDLVKDRTESELTNDDERRVKKTTHQKIEDVGTPAGPKIAPVGGEQKKDPSP